jgi:hypothetical protein
MESQADGAAQQPAGPEDFFKIVSILNGTLL